jgi:acyl-CoA dehydrogenase
MNARNTSRTLDFGDDTRDETADLRDLVDGIARRFIDGRRRGRDVPERFDHDLWRALEDAGLTKLIRTRGLGAGPAELAVVLYGVARHAGAVPIAENDLLARWLAHQAGGEPPDGPLTIAIADADVSDGHISGAAIDAPWTRDAVAVVLAARASSGLYVATAHHDDVDTYDGHNLAGEPRNTLRFDLPLTRFSEVRKELSDELMRRGAWARCVQLVGVLDSAVEHSFAHTHDRVQFGRTLNSFQSVQHSLATMVGEIERSRAVVALAVASAAEYGFAAEHTRHATAVAKVVLGQTVSVITTIAHQLHGAIGVTIEHPLWRSTMRAQSWVGEFGSSAHYARELGRMVLSAETPWCVVTSGNSFFGATPHS